MVPVALVGYGFGGGSEGDSDALSPATTAPPGRGGGGCAIPIGADVNTMGVCASSPT